MNKKRKGSKKLLPFSVILTEYRNIMRFILEMFKKTCYTGFITQRRADYGCPIQQAMENLDR